MIQCSNNISPTSNDVGDFSVVVFVSKLKISRLYNQ